MQRAIEYAASPPGSYFSWTYVVIYLNCSVINPPLGGSKVTCLYSERHDAKGLTQTVPLSSALRLVKALKCQTARHCQLRQSGCFHQPRLQLC